MYRKSEQMESQANKMKKKLVVEALIKKLKNEDDAGDIKTILVEGYARPEKIIKKNNGQKGYMPDLISENKGRKNLYEVELDEENYVLEKWKLFSLYSKKSNGKFSIITPENKLELLQDMLKLNQINARLIYFS
jgi:hypothetical protein